MSHKYFELNASNGKGHGYFAKSDIPSDVNLITESPVAHILDANCISSACSKCLTEGAKFRCTKCKMIFYCSATCQKRDWKAHKEECRFIVNVQPRIPTNMMRMLSRLLILGLDDKEEVSLKEACILILIMN